MRILRIPNRQAGADQEEFRQFLQRICRREATSEDVNLLNSRRMNVLSLEDQQRFDSTIHVYGKNSGVYKRNL